MDQQFSDFSRVNTYRTPELLVPALQLVLDQLYVNHFAFLQEDFNPYGRDEGV